MARIEQDGIISLFENRPKLSDYESLSKGQKEAVDSIVKTALKDNNVLRVGERNHHPKFDDFWMMPWNKLVDVRDWISAGGMFEVMAMIYNIDERQFSDLDIFNAFACYKWIADQVKTIYEIEKSKLYDTPSDEEANLGIEELADYGHAANLDLLSGGDITKEDEIFSKPYAIIFQKLCLIRTKNNIKLKQVQNASRKIKSGF
jgi:hypothetical protein